MMATQGKIAALLVLICCCCIVQASLQGECTLRTNGLALPDSRYYGQPTICNGRCVLKQGDKIADMIGKDASYETIIYDCLIVTIPGYGKFKKCNTSKGVIMINLAT